MSVNPNSDSDIDPESGEGRKRDDEGDIPLSQWADMGYGEKASWLPKIAEQANEGKDVREISDWMRTQGVSIGFATVSRILKTKGVQTVAKMLKTKDAKTNPELAAQVGTLEVLAGETKEEAKKRMIERLESGKAVQDFLTYKAEAAGMKMSDYLDTVINFYDTWQPYIERRMIPVLARRW